MEWEKDAYDGAPTSAHAPCYAPQPDATPCRLVHQFPDLDALDTPPAIPNPLKKKPAGGCKAFGKGNEGRWKQAKEDKEDGEKN